MVNKICVYAIAKNEAHNVDKWVESMSEADSIVVLDTGSTDDTVEKLRAHGVYVEVKTYGLFRFDQARNDSLALIPDDCNIRVTTDLDERFEPGWADILRNEWVEGKHTRANYTYRMRYEEFDQSLNWIHSREWTWVYPCHEAMGRPGGIWYYPDETLDLYGRVILRHFPDQGKDRSNYINLLRLRYKENPDDSQSYLYLLREYTYYEKWSDIVNESDTIRTRSLNYRAADASAAYVYLGDAYANSGNNESAMACFFEAILRYPLERAPYIRLARILIDTGHPRWAKTILLDALKVTQRNVDWTWCDTEEMWTWELYDWLCVACYWSGDYSDATAYAAKALNESPDNEHVKENLRLSMMKMEG